jgi:hypothetical protein
VERLQAAGDQMVSHTRSGHGLNMTERLRLVKTGKRYQSVVLTF